MRAPMVPMMGLCFNPPCHVAFHASRGFPTAPARARASRYTAKSTIAASPPRTELEMTMLPDSLIAAAHRPAFGEVDGKPAWAEDFELDCQGKVMLKSLIFSEMEELMERLGEKTGRAEVLAGWLYHDRRLIRDIAETEGGHGNATSNSVASSSSSSKSIIGRRTRETVRAVATADGGLELEDVQVAADGTRKLVSVLTSGEGAGKKVETVIIPMLRGPQREPRYTICVSSQVGCAMNCQFCYTGRLGLMANLQAAQIVEQVLVAKRFLQSVGDPAPVTGVVFMGMGEPFDNYERVMRAVKILTDPRAGVRLKASSVTVSTVGLVPEMERFCKDDDNAAGLAISLHAVTDEIRDKLIPVNRRYPLAELSETLRTHFPRMSKPKRDETTRASDRSKDKSTDESVTHFVVGVNKGAATPMMATVGEGKELVEQAERLKLKSGSKETFKSAHGTPIEEATGVFTPTDGWVNRQRRRRKSRILAVEYTLLGGVNDSVEDAHRLADWLRGVACVVNLITFNAHEGTPFSSSSLETSKAFRQALTVRGQLCTFRDSRGDDGMAACGQLGSESMVRDGGRARKPVPVAWEPTSLPQGTGVGTSG